MEVILDQATTIEIIKRLLVALVLGALIGYERELHHKPAGFRTHILVSVGSALFTVVSIFGFGDISYETAAGVAVRDASRVAAQIVVGIGFLAAGIIIQDRSTDGSASVRGLTTAASIWMVAAIGMAAGSGMMFIGLVATVLLLIILAALDRFEDVWIKRWQEVHLTTRAKNEPKVLADVMKSLNKKRAIVQKMDVKVDKSEQAVITLELVLHPKTRREDVVDVLLSVDGVTEATID